MPTQPLSRREMISRAGVGIAGAIGMGSIACATAKASSSNPPVPAGTADAAGAPRVSDFPYEKHLRPGYRLDPAPIKEAAYHAYYAGGCCHGSYSALLGHLATTAGAPFTLLPVDFGRFGAGGLDGYGSVCGAVLGSILIVNTVVANPKARAALVTDLLRWYERTPFPSYVPATQNAAEKGLTRDFSAGRITTLQVVPRSHLCHASVSGWCAAVHVSAVGSDKKARCARLTADVAERTVELMNGYLASSTHVAPGLNAGSAACVGCHSPTATELPVASGMDCGACHTDKGPEHPNAGRTRT